ncbi:integrase domain-containing protein [Leeia sp. TBRC 13508]|uniref:Integrase domain-containing protein n=1 Tax=Leeia speluncae TaxID=2884804 RepID=A0ABS8DA51_9NEIS|nr:integrase domain-containing protein [Leeia speluncae]MCB6185091.1 integrase domain-containing protein [Leeia speluncae]
MEDKDWKKQLSELLRQNNLWRKAGKGRVSFETADGRAKTLFHCFAWLRQNGYKVMPKNLDVRHIDAIVEMLRNSDYSPSYRQNYLSRIRTFAQWIGKPHIIKETTTYFQDQPDLIKRSYCATVEKTWEGKGIDAEKIIAEVDQYDSYIGMQLRVAFAFGARRKECIMFRPLESINLEEGIVTIWRGTKGGKLREVKIVTDQQKEMAVTLIEFAKKNRGALSNQDLRLDVAIQRYKYVMHKFGITKKSLGITSHGLRHQFLINRFEDLSGIPAPIRYIPKIVDIPQKIASDNQEDLLEKIEQLKESDPSVAAQLNLIRLFHIPAKLVVRFKPSQSVNAEMTHFLIENPDTGFKTRYVIDSPEKLAAFTQSLIVAGNQSGFVRERRFNPYSAWLHLHNIRKKLGIHLKAMKAEEIGPTLPVILPEMSFAEAKRIAAEEVDLVRRARQITSAEAGHVRISITAAYCGGFRSYVPRKRGF